MLVAKNICLKGPQHLPESSCTGWVKLCSRDKNPNLSRFKDWRIEVFKETEDTMSHYTLCGQESLPDTDYSRAVTRMSKSGQRILIRTEQKGGRMEGQRKEGRQNGLNVTSCSKDKSQLAVVSKHSVLPSGSALSQNWGFLQDKPHCTLAYSDLTW